MVIPLEDGIQSTSMSNYSSLNHLPKGCFIPRYVHRDICLTMYIAALFTAVSDWEQPRCLSTYERQKKKKQQQTNKQQKNGTFQLMGAQGLFHYSGHSWSIIEESQDINVSENL